MQRHRPYFAKDTDGVHFQVAVDGAPVWAHVGRDVLIRRYGTPSAAQPDWVALYLDHQKELDACVSRLAGRDAGDIVIVRFTDLATDQPWA